MPCMLECGIMILGTGIVIIILGSDKANEARTTFIHVDWRQTESRCLILICTQSSSYCTYMHALVQPACKSLLAPSAAATHHQSPQIPASSLLGHHEGGASMTGQYRSCEPGVWSWSRDLGALTQPPSHQSRLSLAGRHAMPLETPRRSRQRCRRALPPPTTQLLLLCARRRWWSPHYPTRYEPPRGQTRSTSPWRPHGM
ncbi:hypothetical protein V8C42DRAFT_244031 [Trichoderma barbatum]